MKIHHILLLNVVLYLTDPVTAQDFAPVGAEWYYTELHAFSGDKTFLKITSLKDTLVNGKDCRLIQKQGNPMCSGRPDVELMYEEAGIVYFWDTTFNKFQPLFDLTKNINEYWIIEVMDERYIHGLDSFVFDVDTIKITVNSISFIEINGKSLKQLYVTYDMLTELHPYSYDSRIIEKIGDMTYLFNYYPWSSVACDGNYAAGLRCYEDPDLGFYSTGIADSCDYIYRYVGMISQEEPSDHFKVFPNPSDDLINVSCEKDCVYVLELTDLIGRTVISEEINRSNQTDISALKNGMYVLTVKNNEKIEWRQILMKY
jgi:hypothetical protein